MHKVLTKSQVLAIRCAHADLLGALQAQEQLDYNTHDWDAHRLSINELEEAFSDILGKTSENLKQR